MKNSRITASSLRQFISISASDDDFIMIGPDKMLEAIMQHSKRFKPLRKNVEFDQGYLYIYGDKALSAAAIAEWHAALIKLNNAQMRGPLITSVIVREGRPCFAAYLDFAG